MIHKCQIDLWVRGPIALRISETIQMPAVCGVWKPVIIIPAGFVNDLTQAEMRNVILHELAHLQQRDAWVSCLQALFQIFYWYNPLVWLANFVIRAIREQAVDQKVLKALNGDSETYASTLLHVARLTRIRPEFAPGSPTSRESEPFLRCQSPRWRPRVG